MSYYHILIEVNDHISTIEETRDIEIFDIVEIQPYLHSILLPYFNEQLLELEDENLEFKDVLHLEVKQTLLPKMSPRLFLTYSMRLNSIESE